MTLMIRKCDFSFFVEKYESYFIVLIQGYTALVNVLLVPVFLDLLSADVFGLWLTVLGTISWFTYFDFGISNSLRNEATLLLSSGKKKEAVLLFSNVLVVFAKRMLMVALLLGIAGFLFDSRALFGVANISEHSFTLFLALIILSVFADILWKLFDAMFYALQKPVYPQLRLALRTTVFSLIVIIQVTFGLSGAYDRLIILSIIFLLSQVLANIFMVIIYWRKYRDMVPSFGMHRKLGELSIFSAGLNFFMIQISSLILFATDNFIIYRLLDGSSVVSYNIMVRMFQVLFMAHSALLIPMWSRYTKYLALGEESKMVGLLMKSLRFSAIIFLCSLIIFSLSKYIWNVWIGDLDLYSSSLAIAYVILILVRLWSSNFSTYLNGTGDLILQRNLSFFAAMINVPLSIYFVDVLKLGTVGVVIATIICLLPFALAAPLKILLPTRV